MLANPEFIGLDLPVFEPNIEIRSPINANPPFNGLKRLVGLGDSWFYRPVATVADTDLPLKSCLRIADDELEKVAELCGSSVVDHQWGLVESASVPKLLREYKVGGYEQSHVPAGYSLVARVAIISSVTEPSHDESKLIEKGFRSYYRSTTLGKHYLVDIDTHQFFSGKNLVDNSKGLWLGDIEPVMRRAT